MGYLETVYDALQFIENNLRNDINVSDIADSVSYSIFHFSRIFNRLTYYSPYDYLIRRRLSEAAKDLINTETQIIDIALNYQFGSPEVFSRAFKKLTGKKPSGWRKAGYLKGRVLLESIDFDYLKYLFNNEIISCEKIKLDAMALTGIMMPLKEFNKDYNKCCFLLEKELQKLNYEKDMSFVNIVYSPEHCDKSLFCFTAVDDGIEINHSSMLSIKNIPASEYIQFIHQGTLYELCFLRQFIYNTWMAKSKERYSDVYYIINHNYSFPLTLDSPFECKVLIPVI